MFTGLDLSSKCAAVEMNQLSKIQLECLQKPPYPPCHFHPVKFQATAECTSTLLKHHLCSFSTFSLTTHFLYQTTQLQIHNHVSVLHAFRCLAAYTSCFFCAPNSSSRLSLLQSLASPSSVTRQHAGSCYEPPSVHCLSTDQRGQTEKERDEEDFVEDSE